MNKYWRTIVFATILSVSLAFDLPRIKCYADLKINDQHYNLSDAMDMVNAYPADAHFDSSGNLFFVKTYSTKEILNFDIFMVKRQCNTAVKVPGLPNEISYSIAIDKKEYKVYFGTGKGIYIYNYETEIATPYNRDIRLDMIFIDKDSNKYITEHTNGVEELYLLAGRKRIRFSKLEALNELAISDTNNFYYIRDGTFFALKSKYSISVAISDVDYDGTGQIAIYGGTVFIACKKLMYFQEDKEHEINIVDDIPEMLTALAFDHSGNFILGTRGKLFMYKKILCNF